MKKVPFSLISAFIAIAIITISITLLKFRPNFGSSSSTPILQDHEPIPTTIVKLPRLHDRETILNGVGDSKLVDFGLTDQDFQQIAASGVTIIQTNFDICADDQNVMRFLNQSKNVGLSVVLPAGVGDTEWGYSCDKNTFPSTQKPEWQKSAIADWISKWKSHPALYGWATANEAGSYLPNANSKATLTLEQLKTAYSDVRSLDPDHPVIIYMNGKNFIDHEDNYFWSGNPFSDDVADIVIVTAHSNFGRYDASFVAKITSRAKSSIFTTSPNTRLVISLAAWKQDPTWALPITSNLQSEIKKVSDHQDIIGIAFFKYGAKGSGWHLPTDAPQLFTLLKS